MRDLMYKFSSEAEAINIFESMSLVYHSDAGIAIVPFIAGLIYFDIIGEISGVSGYHINIRVFDDGFDMSKLSQYQIFPKTPFRIFG